MTPKAVQSEAAYHWVNAGGSRRITKFRGALRPGLPRDVAGPWLRVRWAASMPAHSGSFGRTPDPPIALVGYRRQRVGPAQFSSRLAALAFLCRIRLSTSATQIGCTSRAEFIEPCLAPVDHARAEVTTGHPASRLLVEAVNHLKVQQNGCTEGQSHYARVATEVMPGLGFLVRSRNYGVRAKGALLGTRITSGPVARQPHTVPLVRR